MANSKDAFKVLSLRESVRQELSQPRRRHPKYAVAHSVLNRQDNRYMDVLAYDRTAVTLQDGSYLNANVVTDGSRWWVAAQAPTPRTTPTFWRAIYQRAASQHPLVRPTIHQPDRTILIQLTAWEEKGRPKADNYMIPTRVQGVDVSIGQSEERDDLGSVVTRVQVNDLVVEHYYFGAWPDHGVPSGRAVEQLRSLVLEIERIRGNAEVWVHCSAGVGRTGTFIALSSLLVPKPKTIETEIQEPWPEELAHDQVAQTVDQLREWRGGLVQTLDQFKLIYDMTQRGGDH